MNNINNNTNICFVFSQSTLDIAIEEWVEENCQTKPGKKEAYQNQSRTTLVYAPLESKRLNLYV